MIQRKISICILTTFIVLSQPMLTLAIPPMATLTGLAVSSDVIVIAKVERVSADASGGRLAEAHVLEVWKGNPDPVVTFRASKFWECDVSNAQEGETVVLFLARKPGTTVMSIVYWGQGRIPVKDEDGKAVVVLYLQENCFRIVTDEAGKKIQKEPLIGMLEVKRLEERVKQILRENRAACNSLSHIV